MLEVAILNECQISLLRGQRMVWEEAGNIEGLSYFYSFIFILPPYDDTVTEIIQRFIRWQELKPKETMRLIQHGLSLLNYKVHLILILTVGQYWY